MADKKSPAEKNGVEKQQPLCSSLLSSTEIVTIYVGQKRTPFIFHKHLLIRSSEFFCAAFGSDKFIEGKEEVMYTPDDHPGAVAIFAEWLYSKKIETRGTKYRLDSLYELYILATKLMIPELMDETMSTIQDTCFQFNQFADIKQVVRCHTGTPEGSKLRQFVIDSYHFGRLWEKMRDQSDSAKEQFPEKFLWVDNDEFQRLRFTAEEIRGIWEETRDCFDAFEGVLKSCHNIPEEEGFSNLGWTLRSRGYTRRGKPESYDEDEVEENYPCKYHIHGRSRLDKSECMRKTLNSKASDWIDGGDEEEI